MKLQTVIKNYIKADYQLQELETELEEIHEELEEAYSFELSAKRKTTMKAIQKQQAKVEKIMGLFYGFEPTEEEFNNMVEKAMETLKIDTSDYAMENLLYSNWYGSW
jgi:ATPase subunit of ABC transporter with duplicated ATPase domains